MDKFKLETSIQFPFFKMNELVTYSEVKKPSGVAYILLVLISESKNKYDKLATVLENFGIPKSLHYIFADSIQYLIDQGILENFNFYKNAFENVLKAMNALPDECVMIGDTIKTDIAGARNIGMNAIWVNLNNKPAINIDGVKMITDFSKLNKIL